MARIGAKNIGQLKSKVPSLRKEVESLANMKQIYMYAFDLCRDRVTTHQLMHYEYAEALWNQLITPTNYTYAKQLTAFLKIFQKDLPVKKAITKDAWTMFYEFALMTSKDKSAINKVIEEGVWPTFIEEFAKYLHDLLKL